MEEYSIITLNVRHYATTWRAPGSFLARCNRLESQSHSHTAVHKC